MRQRDLDSISIYNDIKGLLFIFRWDNDIVLMFFKIIFCPLEDM